DAAPLLAEAEALHHAALARRGPSQDLDREPSEEDRRHLVEEGGVPEPGGTIERGPDEHVAQDAMLVAEVLGGAEGRGDARHASVVARVERPRKEPEPRA